jgi:predicted ATPase/DNA-binding CsgD family transcriptional regulator
MPLQPHENSTRAARRDPRNQPRPIPAIASPLFGREADLTGIGDLLTTQRVRLLTLTGSGGTGKTRLALAVAENVAPILECSVYFVDLSAVEDPKVVPARIAQAIGIQDSGSQPLSLILAEVLAERPGLLLLDNFEQVIDSASLIADLLLGCPELTVLITSREPLHVRAERVYPVGTLPVPGSGLSDPIEAAANAAVALFLDRARACRPSFALTRENLPAVAEICTRLDGLPLAIELAAAQLSVLSPLAILERLRARAPFPLDAPRDAPTRHRTLRAAVASSYDLLAPVEQTLFRWSAVFAGGFTAPAAAAVCAPIQPSLDVLHVLAQLADKSLIQVSEEPDGQPRFRWLETIRGEAIDRLSEHGELGEARQRHAVHCLALAEQADSALIGLSMSDTLDKLEREYDNFRAAFHWSLESGDLTLGLSLAGALYRFWMLRGHLSEARQWLEQALPRSDGLALAIRAKALNAAGVLAGMQDDNDAAEAWFQSSLALWREIGDQARMGSAVGNLGLVAQNRHDVQRALECFEQAQALYTAAGDQHGIATSIGCRARVARQQGKHREAHALFDQTVRLFRELGDDHLLANSYANLGHTSLTMGNLEAAAASFRQSLELRQALGNKVGVAECLEGFAAVAGAAGQARRAARLYGAADALRELTGTPVSTTDRAEHDQLLGRIRRRLSESSFATEWAAGRGIELEQAVHTAMDFSPGEDDGLTTGEAAVLTRREREVAMLVANGRTNREIAHELTVAERTVETHLEHIFHKLGLSSRAQVAAWSTRTGLELAQVGSQSAPPSESGASGRLGTRR